MAIEVELKARVSDVRALQVRIERLEGISAPTVVDKDDWYLGGRPLFRLRREGGSVRFTAKEKRIDDGIEANIEHEFKASSDQFDDALGFFTALGHAVTARKTKRGLAYTRTVNDRLGELTIELCEVSTLGWFVELEFVLDDQALVDEARRALKEALAVLEIDDSQIESRPYLQLLSQSTG